MIKYALKCPVEHSFEGWFSSSDGFDEQVKAGQVECPLCGDTRITKAIMAPQVITARKAEATSQKVIETQRKMAEMAHKLRQHVEQTHDYVGGNFVAEARDMHSGLTPERPIYGEASPQEVKSLIDEGVPVAPIPVFNAPSDARPATPSAPAPKPAVRQSTKLN